MAEHGWRDAYQVLLCADRKLTESTRPEYAGFSNLPLVQ